MGTPKTYMCRFSSLSNTFSQFKLMFFNILSRGSYANSQTFYIYVDFDWENAQVNWTYVGTGLGHQMPLLWSGGGTSELLSTGPQLVPFLATRCL